jgi:poly-gamma-glutamate synthesis protein (capsule biosynthesis protein)
LAKEFVAAGADLVIGAHPHVVQESEVIHGVPVFYSLGNFIFDQYWTGAVRSGLGVAVLFTKDGVMNVEQIPFSLMSDRRTCKTQSHE